MSAGAIIDANHVHRWLAYRVNIIQRSRLGGLAEENTVQLKVKKEFLSSNATGYVYNVDIRRIKQSNTDGVRGMEFDLKSIQNFLNVQTDFAGNVIRILNVYEIQEKWRKFALTFRNKYAAENDIDEKVKAIEALIYDEERFSDTLTRSDVLVLLFPPLYGSLQKVGNTTNALKSFPNFFGEESLPLKIVTTLKRRSPGDEDIGILRHGSLDEERYRQVEVERYFKKLTDNYKLDVQPAVKYLETYDLNKRHWITHAGQVLSVNIEGLFRYDQIARLALIE